MYLLILFLIILLIIFIYNNTNLDKIENYIPKDYERSIDIRLCKEESNDVLIPEYDREFNLNDLKIIKEEYNNDNIKQIEIEIDKNIINNKTKKIKLAKIKTFIEDPFYHTFNLESIDNFELAKSDYSIINNIKLKKNQAYLPKNYSINI
jgi:hypothetical protein